MVYKESCGFYNTLDCVRVDVSSNLDVPNSDEVKVAIRPCSVRP